MLADIETFNFNQQLNNSNKDVNDNTETEGAMFNNGADAFIYAYENFVNAPSYHVISRGISTNTIPVLSLTIQTDSKNVMIKYPNGDASYELITYEQGNTYGRTWSKYLYYNKEKGLVYVTETANVRKVNDDLIATYDDNWIYDTAQAFAQEVGMLPGTRLYEFTKRAIVDVTYYKEVKFNNKITEYQTQVISNPTQAGRTYARVIKYMGGATEMPNITQMKTGAIIDAKGVLKVLSFNDEFELKTQIPVLGERLVKCKSNATYNFVTIGGEVLAQRPNVLNARPR